MTLVISCEDCTMRHTTHCRDCVVTAICDEPAHAVIIDAAEERAVRMLARAGLVPVVQHRPQSTCA